MTSSWPSISDYSDALQNPCLCFRHDPELKDGAVVTTDRMGIPIGEAGNLAVVYEFKAGSKSLAVRCFTSPIEDRQQRYHKLHRALTTTQVTAFVDFRYKPEGILVRGKRYPIMTMEWARGRQLHLHVEKHLSQQRQLEALCRAWHSTFLDVHGHRIAHGDLQHGNILLDDTSTLRLIDYDGMYVPDLDGSNPGEFGHRNYQHPQRTQQRYYNADMDLFPFLVIHVSLRALLIRPQLWKEFHNGENLIFRENDFRDSSAPIWQSLRTIGDEYFQQILALLSDWCRRPINTLAPDLPRIKVPPTPTVVLHIESERKWYHDAPELPPSPKPTPPDPVLPPKPKPLDYQDQPLFKDAIENTGKTEKLTPAPAPSVGRKLLTIFGVLAFVIILIGIILSVTYP